VSSVRNLGSATSDSSVANAVPDFGDSIYARFTAMVDARPDFPAAAGESGSLSYRELDEAAAAWSSAILARAGQGPGLVCLLQRNDTPLVASLLGVLRAGKTAVVLGVTEPPARLALVRERGTPQLAIVDAAFETVALEAGFSQDVTIKAPGSARDAPPQAVPSAEQPAFVIFTSGSTGVPKGVVHTHTSFLGILARTAVAYEIEPDDRLAQLFPMSSVGGLTTTLLALVTGGCICSYGLHERGLGPLYDWLESERISVLPMSTTVLRNFVATVGTRRLTTTRFLGVGAEATFAADFALFEEHFPESCEFKPGIGSSEVGLIAQGIVPRGTVLPPEARLHSGRIAPGIEVRLLDEHGHPVSAGEIGEIVVTSQHLAAGYWREEELTRERFSEASDGRRRFHSGDLAFLDEHELLTPVGRKDGMVNVRGNRVELSEVEAAIARIDEITAATVCAMSSLRGTQLVAYLLAPDGFELAPSKLRAALARTLPPYAVPTAFVSVAWFPLNPNSKVDRAELLRQHPPRLLGGSQSDWASPTEELLVGIWSEALDVPGILRDDRFLDLGGDSLNAAVIVANVQETFGLRVGVEALLSSPTVATMAEVVERDRQAVGSGARKMSRVAREQPAPLAYGQERIWRFSRDIRDNVAVMVRIEGSFDLDALKRAVLAVATQHDVLRSIVVEHDGAVMQLTPSDDAPEVRVHDLRDAADPEGAAHDLLAAHSVRPFDLSRGPWFRFALALTAEAQVFLILACHHIGADGASWDVFFGDLAAQYAAELGHREPPEPPPFQFADYSAWQRQALDEDDAWVSSEVDWWESRAAGARQMPILPFARAAVRTDIDPDEGRLVWSWPAPTLTALDGLARDMAATGFAVRIAAFIAALGRGREANEIVLGTYMSNRTLPELRRVIGFIANLVTVRVATQSSESFGDLVTRTRDALLEVAAHSEIPYELLSERLRERGTTPSPIEVIVSASSQRTPELAGLKVTRVPRQMPTHPWGFTLDFGPLDDEGNMLLLFDPRAHDPELVRSFIADYVDLAAELCEHPGVPLAQLLG
jgi:acyl-CoA synthetase (AMP-forming)/AMP-acid ligase II/acyl carrier protein